MLISGFVSHLELDWEDPRHALFLERLGAMGRLIRFDKRGTGMSDRPSGIPDLETRMHDVLAVMDAAGSRRAVVVGYSEGGPMAILLAAMHPSRVAPWSSTAATRDAPGPPDYPYPQTAGTRGLHRETGHRVGLGGRHADAQPLRRTPPCSGGGPAGCAPVRRRGRSGR